MGTFYRFLVMALSLGSVSCVESRDYFPREIVRNQRSFYFQAIPERSNDAMTGTEFLRRSHDLPLATREAMALQEILRGNVPSVNRQMKPIQLWLNEGRDLATVWVMIDYLAIGSDDDFIRIPLNPMSAQEIADNFGCMLPTPKLVDKIYEAADIKLTPQPLQPGQKMVFNGYFLRHNDLIEQQNDPTKAVLVAGHKKDVVVTNRLIFRPNRVAIYGWHDPMGVPIQPVSLVHHNHYADYSHGVRLVHTTMLVNGKPYPVADVLKDLDYHRFLSNEGLMFNPRMESDHYLP